MSSELKKYRVTMMTEISAGSPEGAVQYAHSRFEGNLIDVFAYELPGPPAQTRSRLVQMDSELKQRGI